MNVKYTGIECFDGGEIHHLEEVKEGLADWTCTECEIQVFGEPGTTAISEEV